jgi:hypothetical protein
MVARGCRKQVTAKPEKYAAVSGGEKDFLTVAKIVQFMARFDARSMRLR